jgi:cell division protein FtsB
MSITSRTTGSQDGAPQGLRRKAAKLALGLVVIALLINSLFGDRGVLHLLTQKRHADELAREVASLRHENARLARDIELLRTDPRTVERLAREELGLAALGETVFLLRESEQEQAN